MKCICPLEFMLTMNQFNFFFFSFMGERNGEKMKPENI